MPAAITAASEEPYSTTRCSRRSYQTRCGIPWTLGGAPVTIDDMQTGVSVGNVEMARVYRPTSISSASVGARRVSTARSSRAGVSPSTTTRTSLRRGEDVTEKPV